MITAHKYLDLDLSVVNVGALIIDKLKNNPSLKYDKLLTEIESILGGKAKEVFPYALNFLFLLDKISYLPECDAFQLYETK